MVARVLLGLLDGLYSFDEAAGDLRRRLPGVQPVSLAVDPGAPGRVYCATYNRGLWRSEDRGTTWVPVGTPTSPSFIYRAVEGRWVEDATGYPREGSLVPVLAAAPAAPGRWLALSSPGLFEQRGDRAWTSLTGRPAWRDQHPLCLAVLAA